MRAIDSTVAAWGALTAASPIAPLRVRRRALRPNDLLVRVLFCGVCHSDVHHARDEWGGARFPVVPGHEIVGEVVGLGVRAGAWRPTLGALGDSAAPSSPAELGDLVGVGTFVHTCGACAACRDGSEQHCAAVVWTYDSVDPVDGTDTHGGYSTHIVVDAAYAVRLPPALRDDPARLAATAPLLCAGVTVYGPLRRAPTGARLLVVGLGGLGHVAVRVAAALGTFSAIHVLSTSETKRAYALANGASAFYTAAPLAGGQGGAGGYDLVLDTVSAHHDVGPELRALRRGGTLCLVGLPPAAAPLQIDPMLVASNALVVTGSIVGSRADLAAVLALCFEHGVTADVELIAPDAIEAAYARMLAGDVRFRFVIAYSDA
jgi:uncharacterized zinc-type alcohol dehydrogenase-like protein